MGTKSNGQHNGCIDIDLSPTAALTTDGYSLTYELGGPLTVSLKQTVTAVSDSDTLDTTIQASDTGAFGGEERTVATFTQATAATSQTLSFVGDKYIRAYFNVGGSDVSISCTLRGEHRV